MEGPVPASRGRPRPVFTSFQARLLSILVIAVAVFAAFSVQTLLGVGAMLAASVIAALLVGPREDGASEAFMSGLLPGWAGFSAGILAAYVVRTLFLANLPFGPADSLPLFAVDVLSGIFVGLPFGFFTALLCVVAAGLGRWWANRRSRAARARRPAGAVEDSSDPFGWRSRSGDRDVPPRR